MYGANNHNELVEYSDSDHSGDPVKKRILACYIFTLIGCDKSMLQDHVVLSTAGSNYTSMKEVIKEGILLDDLIQRLVLKLEKFVLYYENQSAFSLVKNHVYHDKTNHI